MRDNFSFLASDRNTIYLVSVLLNLNSPGHPTTAKSLDGIGCFRSARDRKQVFGTKTEQLL